MSVSFPLPLTRAQVRELFTKFGVAGALLDKVVKSISSSDETLLKFMRKVAYCCCWIVFVGCNHSSPACRLILFRRSNSVRRRAKTAIPQ
jgi:hypothetical protein